MATATLSSWVSTGRADIQARKNSMAYAQFARRCNELIAEHCGPDPNREFNRAPLDISEPTCECGNDKMLMLGTVRWATSAKIASRSTSRGVTVDGVNGGVNVLAFGLPGTGKTLALCALGHRHRLVEAGHSVLFAPAYRLVRALLAGLPARPGPAPQAAQRSALESTGLSS